MKRISPLAAVAGVILLAGCAPTATPAAETSASATPRGTPTPSVTAETTNVAACTYFAENLAEQMPAFVEQYLVARELAEEQELDQIVGHMKIVDARAEGELAEATGDVLDELLAIQQRYANGNGTDPDVDYDALVGRSIDALDICTAELS